MQYIKQILLPEEKVLVDARVHPVLLFPGVALIGCAVAILKGYPDWFDHTQYVAKLFYALYSFLPVSWFKDLYRLLTNDSKALAVIFCLWGIKSFCSNLVILMFSELVVTDRRVIAKIGVTTTTAIEMDRRRIAGVVVHQSMWGRMLNYGYVFIQGFSGSISMLPVLADPYKIQQALNER